MQVPRHIIDEVRSRTDIVEVIGQAVTLRANGSSHIGLCPFHQEKTPSFHVLRSKQIFHCFGCKEGGDVFAFLMKTRGLSFIEALKELAGPAGVVIEERDISPQEHARIRHRASLYDACELATEFFHRTLLTSPQAAEARAYLAGRGLTHEAIQRFKLGFAPDGWTGLIDHLQGRGLPVELLVRAGLAKRNERRGSHYDVFRARIIIPIADPRDRVVAFGGRLMAGEGPKYLNSPETEIYEKSKTLYGLSQARTTIQRRDRALVVEGYFDVISLAMAGFSEAVATCGTALTPDHLEHLRRLTRTVIALFDADEAGQRAAERALPVFLDKGVEARHLALPSGKDPDEFVRAEGAEAFEALMGSSRPLVEIVVSRVAARHGSTPGGRQGAVDELAPVLRKMPEVMRSDMLLKVANLLGVGEAVLRDRVGRVEAPPRALPREGGGGARWVGNVELNRLLWLLIHQREASAPVVARVEDPSIVTDRLDVGRVIFRLMQGAPLPAVLDEVQDPDLTRVLLHVATQEGLCRPDQAEAMARQVLARLERRAIEGQLADLRRRIGDAAAEPQRQRELIARKAALQRRLKDLMPLARASV